MRFHGFIGPSYTAPSINFDCQRTINLYLENDEIGTGKDAEPSMLIGTPGLNPLFTVGSGPGRGGWETSTGVLYVVSGNTVYQINDDWTFTSVGTLLTSSGPVGMADNGLQLVIVDGANGYYLNLPGGTITQITDPEWLGSNTVTFQDGYFIFVQPNTNKFYLSDLNAITFTAPAITSKEGFPDNIISAISVSRVVWLLGDQTSEVFYDSGDQLNPFQFVPSTLQQYGLVSPFGVTKIANTLAWIGKDSTGAGIVFMANGYTPQRISTYWVERSIQGYSTISDAIAWSYQENGHNFLVLTFPTGNATWVYDISTNSWHERAYNNQGTLQRHRANCYVFGYGKHIVGDYQSGIFYEQSLNVYTDNGTPIIRQRVSPHLSQDMVRIFFSSFQLDIESGTGIDGSGQGINPQAMLQWSNDGGHTWSNEVWASFGAIGATRARAIWRRLGQSRNRVFKVAISDPVKVALMGAELYLSGGTS